MTAGFRFLASQALPGQFVKHHEMSFFRDPVIPYRVVGTKLLVQLYKPKVIILVPARE